MRGRNRGERAAQLGITFSEQPNCEQCHAPRTALKHCGHILEPAAKLGDARVAPALWLLWQCGASPWLAAHSSALLTRVVPAALRVDKQSRRQRRQRSTPAAMARSRYSLAPQATPAKGQK